MITIHESNTTEFNTLGLGALVPSSCIVQEELNGLFELEMEHSYDEWGKWKNIENNRIIVATTPRGKQAFRIYKVNPTMENIKVNARHIFYDLLDNFVLSYQVNNMTATEAIERLQSRLTTSMPFTLSTDITTTGSISMYNVNPIYAIMSLDNDNKGFISVFGGELLRDNYKVQIKTSIGTDKGVVIRYSKNLIGLEIEEDISNVATRIYGVWGDEGYHIPNRYIDSPLINSYPFPKIYLHEDTSAKSDSECIANINKLYENGIDKPIVNIRADFQLLAKTAEYKNYAMLEDVQLGDIVTVINNKMNFNKKATVISYKWDCLLDKYNTVELGDFVKDITQSITSGEKAVNSATSANTTVKQVYSMISGNITIVNDTLYICIDSKDYTTANKLFKWGINGLQFSSTGVNGTWSTIINTEGQIV